ncbi:hypothetical protein JI58_02680 [Marinosulfonomonas sp. PRT-SC04]|nr:hypothetical protein JI58_02680 [Marinosulfonomonas sp. PRT-SC04]
MRSSKTRSRGNKNRSRQSSGNNGNNGNNQNRVFDSSGPEGKVRGTPQQIIDKYNQLARDAHLSNDTVAAENFQQHAEHYTRMLAESMREAEVKREQHEAQNRERQQQRDSERAERQDRDAARAEERNSERNSAQSADQGEAKAVDPASAPQPEMASDAASDNSGLVDTPESKPAPRKRTRTRKPKVNPLEQAAESSDTSPQTSEKPDASEAAE